MRLGLGVALAALALAPQRAAAQTPEQLEKARVQFQEAMALAAANNCAAAIPKYRAVAAVKMTTQVAFNIAECEERLDKLVSALGDYNLAATLAGTDKRAQDLAARIPERVTALEERIPKLTIKRGRNASTAVVELDGSELGPGKLSTEIPLDPGAHSIVAKVGDKEVLRGTVTLVEKDNKVYEVNIESTRPVEAGAGPGKGEVPTFEKEAPKEAPAAPPSKVPGIIAVSAGGAAIIVGGIFMGLRSGAISDLDKLCGGDTKCPPSAEPTSDKGKLYTGVAEVSFLAGAAGLGVGIYLLVRASSPPPPPKQAETALLAPGAAKPAAAKPGVEVVGWAPGASVGGLSVVGSF